MQLPRLTFLKKQFIFMLLLLLTPLSVMNANEPTNQITVKKNTDTVAVLIDNKLFTEYHFCPKTIRPYLWPVNFGPANANLVRNYPIQKGVAGEEYDHPHHTGIWFAHMPMNGVNFWHNKPPHGKLTLDKIHFAEVQGKAAVIKASHNWLDPDGKTVCTDTRTITIRAEGETRTIDFEIVLKASHGKLTLGDNKEGTMAIRTATPLRLTGKPKKGVYGKGHALNSAGDRDRKLWGKNAKWVDYWGPIQGETVGIAIFDHPQNLRHPTTWHARNYGLVTANPFGQHYFKNKPKGAGDYTIEKGKSLRFRYRFVFHTGDAKQAKVEKLYQEWVASEAVSKVEIKNLETR